MADDQHSLGAFRSGEEAADVQKPRPAPSEDPVPVHEVQPIQKPRPSAPDDVPPPSVREAREVQKPRPSLPDDVPAPVSEVRPVQKPRPSPADDTPPPPVSRIEIQKPRPMTAEWINEDTPSGDVYTYVSNKDPSNRTNVIRTSQNLVRIGGWGYFLPAEYNSVISWANMTPGQSGPAPTPARAVAYGGTDGTIGGPGGTPLADQIVVVNPDGSSGYVPIDNGDGTYSWGSQSGGGGGGTVDSVVGSDTIDVDATDPANPVISASSSVVSVASDGTLDNVPLDNGDGTYSWGPPPGGAGDPVGWWSLQEHFSLTPCSLTASLATIETQTTAIQDAIDAAVTAGMGLDLGKAQWAVYGALTVSGALAIRAQGAGVLEWGYWPDLSPFFVGGAFVQTQKATDILQVNLSAGTSFEFDLDGVVLAFAKLDANDGTAVAFSNTGYGITTDNVNFDYRRSIVFGQDGSHYAYHNVQSGYGKTDHIKSFGGGGWYHTGNASGFAGNITHVEPNFQVFVGSTPGICHDSTGTTLNLITMIRPQSQVITGVHSTALGVAYGITSGMEPAGTVPCYEDIANPPRILLIAPDFEPITQTVTYGNGTQVIGPELSSNAVLANLRLGPLVPGSGAKLPIPTGINNIVGGSGAGVALTTGHDNLLLGTNAGETLTTGNQNIAIGSSALAAGTSAGQNVAVGPGALENATSNDNVAVGFNALSAQTSGTQNTAIGWAAVTALTTASNVTAVGYQALDNNSGTDNTAVGSQALKSASGATGHENTAVGATALTALTTGLAATVVGSAAGNAITTGSDNTIVGQSAGQAIVTGSKNTIVGQAANLGSDISNCTAIGQGTSVTGSGGVAIGIDSGGGAATAASNVIALGTANHTLSVLGNASIAGSGKTLGFFATTKVVQQSSAGTATGYTAGTTTGTFHSDDTYTGNTGTTAYTINGVVAALKNYGLLAA